MTKISNFSHYRLTASMPMFLDFEFTKKVFLQRGDVITVISLATTSVHKVIVRDLIGYMFSLRGAVIGGYLVELREEEGGHEALQG